MPFFRPLRADLVLYLKQHNLIKKWLKIEQLFQQNPRHPSLHTELLEPKENLIYSFRLDKKYRALFYVHEDKSIEVFAITNHYK